MSAFTNLVDFFYGNNSHDPVECGTVKRASLVAEVRVRILASANILEDTGRPTFKYVQVMLRLQNQGHAVTRVMLLPEGM